MDRETEEYFNNYFSLFLQQGWKQLVQDFNVNGSQINSIEAAKDCDDLNFRKGQLNVIAHLLNLETIMTTNYEQAKEETKEEDD